MKMKLINGLLICMSIACNAQDTEVIMSKGKENSEKILREIVSNKIFENHFKFDFDNSRVKIIVQQELIYKPLKTEVVDGLLGFSFSYHITEKEKLITIIVVNVDKYGDVISTKKSLSKTITPYRNLLEGKINVGVDEVKIIAKNLGLNTESVFLSLICDREKKNVWIVTERITPQYNRVIRIDSKTGDLLEEYGEVIHR